ncbi:1-deoxy-D-xylulose-5-phosphate reductoisomerase [Sporosalibacterium faouarense]|uniref:1-deoxy-D-xylulose-5-phosphate reductoisomerase n=1 Tax=Sporosalibacterium faouarense TaxID=516123 RepID=UPI00141C9AFC|nr:1-deoxy-D-xylulose-5-phosphate reductoisomerase [Sporosalibacterium faouarense]MTI48028.1 1-deoxy-D-xylulose-5-phosphate reductoisomerase [Bacillota bacterium]
MKKISILGSTGSIGTQALDIAKGNSDYKIVGLTANKNIELLEKQITEFSPKIVAVVDEDQALILKKRLHGNDVNIVSGIEGLVEVATYDSADIVLNSVVGMVGLLPTLEAIKAKKTIALANKETLVTAGEIVMNLAREKNVSILPVDSEHSAIFQCLKSGKKNEVSKLILTASGGPFRGLSKNDLEKVTLKDALNHPNWSMGKKITIDSATLMNKGLEVIEAKWLFDIDINKIDVLVHPQSIVHSMVEFIDGSVIAQLGIHDMRIPIQYALNYPDRKENILEKLDLANIGQLNFEKPDNKTFPALSLAIQAMKEKGTMAAVLNGANESAVQLFLEGKIKFIDIARMVEKVMSLHHNIKNPTLEDVLEVDKWARRMVLEQLN